MTPEQIAAMIKAGMAPHMVERLTMDAGAADSPFIADDTPFFDRCQDELMSLHYGGRMGLMDLFDWQVTDVYKRSMKYITFVRPEYDTGDPTPGYLADPCEDPHGYEFGTAEFDVEGFGRYGRLAPVREIFEPERYCESDPRNRLDGSIVTSEFEWDLRFILDVLMQDLYRDIIVGNSSTDGQFDGLQQWINTGYDSDMLDSNVVDWAGNDFEGTGGGSITLNGDAVSGSYGIIEVLQSLYRRFKQRIKWSPQLAGQTLRRGNFVLVLPTFLIECLLDSFTCWSVCADSVMDTYEARNLRSDLSGGGAYGAGYITLDGDVIDLFPYDWETTHGSQRGDMYFLTRSVGNVRLWQGEHLSAAAAASEMRREGHDEYFATDGGRILGTTTVDNLCRQTKAWIRPRLYCRAPWLQARISNVECETLMDPLSPDPLSSSFYPLSSFTPDTVG